MWGRSSVGIEKSRQASLERRSWSIINEQWNSGFFGEICIFPRGTGRSKYKGLEIFAGTESYEVAVRLAFIIGREYRQSLSVKQFLYCRFQLMNVRHKVTFFILIRVTNNYHKDSPLFVQSVSQ